MTDDIETFDFEDGDGEAGKCPYCGGSLTYGACEKDATGLIYPWTCDKCGKQGKETYEVTFTGHYHK